MLSYTPGDSLAHRLDPRTKLLAQAAFAAAAFVYTTPQGLATFTVVAVAFLTAGRLSPIRAIRGYLLALPFLAAGPLVSVVEIRLWAVGINFGEAVGPLLASYRVLLVLIVSAVYLHTTPVRESRAAIQRLVPGRPGRLLGVGVALVFRFLPLLRADLQRIRDASAVRLSGEQGLRARMEIVASAGIRRALGRADRLALALRARCFAWNPTLPELRFGRPDAIGLFVAAGLVGVAVVGVVPV